MGQIDEILIDVWQRGYIPPRVHVYLRKKYPFSSHRGDIAFTYTFIYWKIERNL